MSAVITREELVRAMHEGTITLIEALPAPHYAAEHPPGVHRGRELTRARLLP